LAAFGGLRDDHWHWFGNLWLGCVVVAVGVCGVGERAVVVAVEGDEEIIRLEGGTVVVLGEVKDVHHGLIVCVPVH